MPVDEVKFRSGCMPPKGEQVDREKDREGEQDERESRAMQHRTLDC